MDKIFKTIGRGFKAIWDWIKTTAWIQPLLIVALVFGVIFSISPLTELFKSWSNSDTAGEFYKDHRKGFADLYSDIFTSGNSKYDCEVGKKPDGKSAGKLLNDQGKYDGYTYVLFVSSDSNESTIKTFYNNTLTKEEQKHFYVVDFREDANKKSSYNNGEWVDNSGATYYNYLLNHLYEFYHSEAYEEYSDAFKAEYKYSAKIAEWELTSTDESTAVNDIDLPLICKYKGAELIDFRFCNSFSSDYDKHSAAEVLTHFHNFSK